jgi:hypothetical protein
MEQRRAHKQALSDQQFQEKHDEIQGMIENLHNQLDAVPKEERNTPDYLKMQDQLAQAIQDRNAHWKSVDQPNALSKFGKMLGKDLRFKKQEAPTPVAPPVYGQPTMDVNGEKVPTGPAYKVQGPQTPAQMKAAAEAAQLVASGPVSPEQQGTQRGQGQAAEDLAEFQGKMKLYDQNHPEGAGPNATPEGKQARQGYANDLLMNGIKEPKEPIETWTDVKGAVAEEYPKGSGQYRILQQNKKGERHWGDALAPDAPKQGKPGTSVFSVSLDTYAKSHGYDSFNDVPNDYKEKIKDYEIRKGVLDRTISKKSVVTRVMQDAEGHPFTATVTNYSGPAGNEELIDPMPIKEGAAPPSSGPTNATPNPAKTNPSSPTLDKVKKDAKALNTPSAGGRNATYGTPDTSIQMKTPGITKLGEQHDAAVELVSEAQDAVAQPNNAELQFLLVDNLLHGALGRVNEIEIKRIQDRGGWFLAPERWEAEAKSGTMAPQLVKQLYDFTLSQQKAIEKAQATHGNPTDVKNQANKTQWPKAPDIGTVEDGDDGKHKYIGGDPTKKESWQKVTQ